MRLQSFSSLGATLLLVTAVGCAGEFQPGPGAGSGVDETPDAGAGPAATALESYEALHGELMIQCQACHVGPNDQASAANGPDFFGPDNGVSATYESVLVATSTIDGAPLVAATPQDSKLFYYGSIPHTGSLGMTPELAEAVESWIIQKAEEDGLTPEPDEEEPEGPEGPTSIVQALEMFASCMRYEDFIANDFPLIAELSTAEGECSRCHSLGEFGAHLNRDPVEFYIGQRSLNGNGELAATSIHAFVTAAAENGGYVIKQTKRYQTKGTGTNVANHPNYIFSNEGQPFQEDVDLFFEATMLHYEEALATGVPCTPDDPLLN